MACNRDPSADGTTSSVPSVCPNPDALVPCCNNNCHFFGCAATMNLCSKCYSEYVLKEGAGVLYKPCDAATDTPDTRVNTDGADKGNTHENGDLVQRIDDTAASGGSGMVAMPAEELDLQEPLQCKARSMNRSAGMSDLHAIFRSVETSRAGDLSEFPQPRIPSPLSLPRASPRAFSPARRQVEPKSSLPPLPRQQAVNRCLTCRKRVGLLGFKCRCGDVFCALHRYSDKHDCSFDYKAAGRAAIAKENPVVQASKIERI